MPAMINSLYGLDGRLVVEALADVETILSDLDEASFPGCITDPLQQLFDDVRRECGVAMGNEKQRNFSAENQ